ncbi:WD40/YVTN/BNR-like repeat-containing protein [Paenibacillus hamazuiensis]|uniref:WD40/YVTN/BNR-like repeat-containing protein n=1 Tax=Paenibacillus hamazuiensis TaxID=2936508 RepID=UPI00200D9AE8|nr:hypothetical protein [Paenibacillus hamazuiensis]
MHTTFSLYKKGGHLLLAAFLLLTGCQASASSHPAGSTAPGGAAVSPPAAGADQPDNGNKPAAPDASGNAEAAKPGDRPAAPSAGTGSEPAPATEPRKLADMYFTNERLGWTVGETKMGSTIWKTSDKGASWNKSALQGVFVRGIGFAGETQGWAVGKTDCREQQGSRLCTGLQISHSADGGKTWSTQWTQKVQDVDFYSKDKVFVVNERQVYAIAGNRMLRTVDGGQHWSLVDFQIGPFLAEQAVFLTDGKNGWVMGRVGKGCKPNESTGEQCAVAVVNTADGGQHWKLQWSPDNSTGLQTVGISFINPSKGWMMILSMETLQSSLYGTTDGGTHWSKISEMRGGRPYTRGLQFVSETTGFVPLSAGAGPVGGGLAVTRDGGKNFERKIEEGKEWSFEQLQFFSEQAGWVRVFDPSKGDYLMYTADGGNTWKTSVPQQ